MDARDWDERYARSPLLWTAEPNRWVVQHAAALTPGRALDLAAGEGRNAVWLASMGWTALAVDFSPVAVERVHQLAVDRLGPRADAVSARVEDVLTWAPPVGAFDLVLLSYLHVGAADRQGVLTRAAAAVAPGGHLLVVGHDVRNLAEGYGGPSDASVLYGPQDVATDLTDTGLVLVHAATEPRPVTDPDGVEQVALDVVVLARRDAAIRAEGEPHA